MAFEPNIPVHCACVPGHTTRAKPFGSFPVKSALTTVYGFPLGVVYKVDLFGISTMPAVVARQEKEGGGIIWDTVSMGQSSYLLFVFLHTLGEEPPLAKTLPGWDASLGEGPTQNPKLAFGQQGVVLLGGVSPNGGKSSVHVIGMGVCKTYLSRYAGHGITNNCGL